MSDREGDLLTDGISEEQPAEAGNQQPEGSGESESTPGADSSERPGWMDQLKGDLKDSESLRKFPSATDLAKSYVELEGKLGKAVTVSEEPTEEELSRVRTLLGVPEKVEDYDFSDVKLPEGFKLTDGAAKDLAAFAHENNLSVPQAKSILGKIAARENEAVRQVRQVYQAKRSQAETQLRQDLGEDYDKVLKAGQNVLQEYADKDLINELKDTGFGNSPAMVKFLGNLGRAVSESEAPQGGQPQGGQSRTPFPFAAEVSKRRQSYYD